MKGAEAEGESAGHGAPGEWMGYPVCGPKLQAGARGPEREKARCMWGTYRSGKKMGGKRVKRKNESGRVEKAR